MKNTIFDGLIRFLGVAVVASIVAGFGSFVAAGMFAYSQSFLSPADLLPLFKTSFAGIFIAMLFWWIRREFKDIRKGLMIAKIHKVPLDDVLWLARRFNQFEILETYTREEFLRELEEEKRHRPHHPSCDEGD